MGHDAQGIAGSFAGAALVWIGMMGLMMGPTVAPWVVAFGRVIRPQASWLARVAGSTAFAGGYFMAWAAFGVLAAGVSNVVDIGRAWLGALLVVAGVFQVTPLKQACLTHCRNPLSFLLVRWRRGPGPALRLGALHGVYCVGCCWALMLIMLAVGAADMIWMVAIAVVVFVEQVAPGGGSLRVPLAAGLVVAGLWTWLS